MAALFRAVGVEAVLGALEVILSEGRLVIVGGEAAGGEAGGGEAGARLSAGSGHACDHGLARHGSGCARPDDEGRAAARDTRAASARRAGTRVAASRVW